MDIKLTNSQTRVLIGLSQQRMELQKQFEEINEAETEYLEMLKNKHNLKNGEYRLEQKEDGIYIVKNEKIKEKINKED